jgi:hypothetical protein
VPLETRARFAAERLLVLTEALADAIVSDRADEVPALMASRQSVLDQLATMDIDAAARAVLERVWKSDAELTALTRRAQGQFVAELATLVTGTRSVQAYRSGDFRRPTLQRTG